MTTCVIELNDDELRVASNTEVLATAAGCAALVGDGIVVGAGAQRHAHRQPRASETRHWRDLSLAPIDHLGPRARHFADLAWLQLEQLRREAGNPAEAVLAVPGSFSTEQLSLLLGIALSSGLRVGGLVDSAVGACAASLGAGHWLHLDLQQHQAVLTRLAVDAWVHREAVEVLPGLGTLRLRTLCLEEASAAFVREARFDPLHHADAEAALLERLPGWMDALRQSAELQVSLDHAGRRFQARLQRARLIAATASVLRELRAALPAGLGVVASHRLARQPGFSDGFPGIAALTPRAVFMGCRAAEQRPHGANGSLPLQTSLPSATTPAVQLPASTAPVEATATHLLCGAEAIAVGPRGLHLLAAGTVDTTPLPEAAARLEATPAGVRLSPAGPGRVLVNGTPLSDARLLTPGDRVSFVHGNGLFTAIRVRAGDAA